MRAERRTSAGNGVCREEESLLAGVEPASSVGGEVGAGVDGAPAVQGVRGGQDVREVAVAQ